MSRILLGLVTAILLFTGQAHADDCESGEGGGQGQGQSQSGGGNYDRGRNYDRPRVTAEMVAETPHYHRAKDSIEKLNQAAGTLKSDYFNPTSRESYQQHLVQFQSASLDLHTYVKDQGVEPAEVARLHQMLGSVVDVNAGVREDSGGRSAPNNSRPGRTDYAAARPRPTTGNINITVSPKIASVSLQKIEVTQAPAGFAASPQVATLTTTDLPRAGSSMDSPATAGSDISGGGNSAEYGGRKRLGIADNDSRYTAGNGGASDVRPSPPTGAAYAPPALAGARGPASLVLPRKELAAAAQPGVLVAQAALPGVLRSDMPDGEPFGRPEPDSPPARGITSLARPALSGFEGDTRTPFWLIAGTIMLLVGLVQLRRLAPAAETGMGLAALPEADPFQSGNLFIERSPFGDGWVMVSITPERGKKIMAQLRAGTIVRGMRLAGYPANASFQLTEDHRWIATLEKERLVFEINPDFMSRA